MEFALGVLNWTPETFWKSTHHELMTANRGYIKANKVPDKNDGAMTRDEFEEMKENIENMKRMKANG